LDYRQKAKEIIKEFDQAFERLNNSEIEDFIYP